MLKITPLVIFSVVIGFLSAVVCADVGGPRANSESPKSAVREKASKHATLELKKWKNKDFCEQIQKGVQEYADSDLLGKKSLSPVDIGGDKMEFPQWQNGSLELGMRNSSPHTTEAYFSKFDADNDGRPDLVVRKIYYSKNGTLTHEDLHVLPYQEIGNESILKIPVDETYKYPRVRFSGRTPSFWDDQYDSMLAKNKISAFSYMRSIYFIFYSPMDFDLPGDSSREIGFLVAQLGEAKPEQYEGAPVISSLKYQCLYVRSNAK